MRTHTRKHAHTHTHTCIQDVNKDVNNMKKHLPVSAKAPMPSKDTPPVVSSTSSNDTPPVVSSTSPAKASKKTPPKKEEPKKDSVQKSDVLAILKYHNPKGGRCVGVRNDGMHMSERVGTF